jgi:hypothetical protein
MIFSPLDVLIDIRHRDFDLDDFIGSGDLEIGIDYRHNDVMHLLGEFDRLPVGNFVFWRRTNRLYGYCPS